MPSQHPNFLNVTPLNSHNAIFYFIITNRNRGKTWAFKMRALLRFIKRKKKTVWVRRFQSDVKTTLNTSSFYPVKMLRLLKIKPDDVTKNGNNMCYKKQWFLKVVALSSQQKLKGNDLEGVDTIVFDEFTTTETKYNQYKGNEVNDFLDLYITYKRQNDIRCYFLGNKETFNNPYFRYFNITPPPLDFTGIKTYKNNSILVYQDNVFIDASEKADKLKHALKETPYYNYLYGGDIKNNKNTVIRELPKNATVYVQLLYRDVVYTFYTFNNCFYLTQAYDKNKKVYAFEIQENTKVKYILLSTKDLLYFGLIRNAIKFLNVYATASELTEPLNYFIDKIDFKKIA